MPLYDYRCRACHGAFDEFVRVDGLAPACPKCGGPSTRLFTPTARTFVPLHMRAGNEGDGGHRRWLNSAPVQAKLKSGEYEPAPRRRTPLGES